MTWSIPGISSSGNMRPQSIAMTWSAYSTSIMLRPISPSPPSGIRRTAGSAPPADGWALVSTSSYSSGVGCGRAQGVARGVAPPPTGLGRAARTGRGGSPLPGRLTPRRSEARRGEPRELLERERLGPAAAVDAGGSEPLAGRRGWDVEPGGERVGDSLAALAERGEDDRPEAGLVADRHRRLAPGPQMKDGRLDPRRGPEGPWRHPQLEPNRPVELNQNRQATVGPAPWRGRDALGDLALEHQGHLGDRRVGVAEPHEDRLRHAVREVADHEHAPAGRRQPSIVPRPGVGLPDVEAVRQAPREPGVELEPEEPTGAGSQRRGEGA